MERISRILRRFVAKPGRPEAARSVVTAAVPMTVTTCTLFYSYFRLHMVADLTAAVGSSAEGVWARVWFGGEAPRQKAECRSVGDGRWEIIVEALVDPAAFPGDGVLEVTRGGLVWRVLITDLLQAVAAGQGHPLLAPFRDAIADWVARHAPTRPRLLDIGGRARSGARRGDLLPECDVTTFDIVPEAGVDVVGDAHELSRHFPTSHFDFAMSLAVFEHLAMPWKVAVEMARVLRPGGLAWIYSHQTVGLHDLPWDFFRFSDAAWPALFNRYTGFEVVETRMVLFMQIVPRAWGECYRGSEGAGGFEGSAVLVRKVGEPAVDWPVPLPEIIGTAYPRS